MWEWCSGVNPRRDYVIKFARGLGLPEAEALQAAGYFPVEPRRQSVIVDELAEMGANLIRLARELAQLQEESA